VSLPQRVLTGEQGRNTCTYWATSAQRIGFCPSTTRPVKPLPIATETRPGACAASVPIAAAVTIGCRRLGTMTPGPNPIVDVRAAASAKIIQTSGYSAGES